MAVLDRAADKLLLYLDGVEVNDTEIADLGGLSGDREATIGGTVGGMNDVAAAIDEVRVRHAASSAAFISVQHASLRRPEDFLSVGPQESVP